MISQQLSQKKYCNKKTFIQETKYQKNLDLSYQSTISLALVNIFSVILDFILGQFQFFYYDLFCFIFLSSLSIYLLKKKPNTYKKVIIALFLFYTII